MCLAVPGKILSVEGDDPIFRAARVSFAGIVKQVSLALIPQAQVGDYVLVHVGFAINTIDEQGAKKVIADLERLGEFPPRERDAN